MLMSAQCLNKQLFANTFRLVCVLLKVQRFQLCMECEVVILSLISLRLLCLWCLLCLYLVNPGNKLVLTGVVVSHVGPHCP